MILKREGLKACISTYYFYKEGVGMIYASEEAVIQKTSKAILNLNYPEDKVEILIFADNCTDRTAELAEAIGNRTEYQKRQFKVIRRTGEGGKSGVLNDALKMIHGDYLCVYDADAMPEENALYFLI